MRSAISSSSTRVSSGRLLRLDVNSRSKADLLRDSRTRPRWWCAARPRGTGARRRARWGTTRHQARIARQPDRAVLGTLPPGSAARPPASAGRPANRPCRAPGPAPTRPPSAPRMLAELPAQVVAGDELPSPGMERSDVVVLEVDLDEGSSVVVALVDMDAVEHEAFEVEGRPRSERVEFGRDVGAAGLEIEAVPALQRVVAQVQARVVGEVRRAEQATVGRRSSGAAGGRRPGLARAAAAARMIAWRWRQTLDISSTPVGVPASGLSPLDQRHPGHRLQARPARADVAGARPGEDPLRLAANSSGSKYAATGSCERLRSRACGARLRSDRSRASPVTKVG